MLSTQSIAHTYIVVMVVKRHTINNYKPLLLPSRLCDDALSSITKTECNVGTPVERPSEHRTASAEVSDGHEPARSTMVERNI